MQKIKEPLQGLRRHKLITAEIRRALPGIGETDGQGLDAVAQLKLFGPGRFTFYVTEYDGENLLFGYTVSALGQDCDEWGYASLEELASMTHGPFGTPAIERDCWFDAQTVRDAIA